MKLQPPKNPNYCATVVRVKNLVPLEGCDNVVGMPMFGMQAIVGIDTKIGDVGILFPTEVQLSERYCHENNLFRHAELNIDTTKKGYIEDNRRVKSIKFRGHRSDAFFMPLSSLQWVTKHSVSTPVDDQITYDLGLKEGDEFDTLNGYEICSKYELPVKGQPRGVNQPKSRRPNRVDARDFPEQDSITHFLKVAESLPKDARVIVTQKLHGTNIRVGNVRVRRQLTIRDRIARWFGASINNMEYDYVYGSHHVVKDANFADHNHYYNEDIWTRKGRDLDGLIPRGYVVYGELVGWTSSGRPIQSSYTYDEAPGHSRIYVYRVVHINEDGLACDLSWDAVREFCKVNGLRHVPELLRCKVGMLFNPSGKVATLDELMDTNYALTYAGTNNYFVDPPVPLAKESPCDEGVVIRIEGITPQFYKVKAPMYLAHETKQLDKGEPDIESSEVEE